MILTPTQKKAVNSLFEVYQDAKHKAIDFKAPTGSGKTLHGSAFYFKSFCNK